MSETLLIAGSAALLAVANQKFQEIKKKNAPVKKINGILLTSNIVSRGKNEKDERNTFTVKMGEQKKYGFDCKFIINPGLNYDMFKTAVPFIQDNYPCLMEYNKEKISNQVDVQFITKNFASLKFRPIKTLAEELVVGYDASGEPIILNMHEDPHVLVTGVTGSGKSRCLMAIILNSIVSDGSENHVRFRLYQPAKSDLFYFKNCNKVDCCLQSLNDISVDFLKVFKMMQERERAFRKDNVINIRDYNKKHPENSMPIIYLVVEEYSFFMIRQNGDDPTTQRIKGMILNLMEKVILDGRSSGVFMIIGIQRPTADMLPAALKAMCSNKVAFRQTNKISSQVVIDTDDCLGLMRREAIVLNSKMRYMRTYSIDDKTIYKYLGLFNNGSVLLNPGGTAKCRIDNFVMKEIDSTMSGDAVSVYNKKIEDKKNKKYMDARKGYKSRGINVRH